MYSEVTITDDSWKVMAIYGAISFFIAVGLFLWCLKKISKIEYFFKIVIIIFLSSGQYYVALWGIDSVYHYFNFKVWDDGLLRLFAALFFVLYAFLTPDWKMIISRKKRKHP
ncbi:hypothetical protein [Erwinia oleae]|uniref:hypothetical protein n=1 Tax=Erwinia oleae TaxID=796334 RepID=UPI00068E3BC3|nr:hypothetical protein [Erwinia oleae]